MSETDELARKLAHRNAVNEGEAEAKFVNVSTKNIYLEFQEFTRKQVQDYEDLFNKFDTDKDKVLDQGELQVMMEKLGAAQTYRGLKDMIKEVDEDNDGAISFREFLLIFRKAANNELVCEGLQEFARVSEIDVDETGVSGAKSFFEAKANEVGKTNKFEEDIRQEQEERKKELEAARIRKQEFEAKKAHLK